jgi:hypothetical protein
MAENLIIVEKNKKMHSTLIVPTTPCFPLIWNRIFRFLQTKFQIMKKQTVIHGTTYHAV